MYYAYPSEDGVCFNRTFMELKYQLYICVVAASNRFNRTFMELKFVMVGIIRDIPAVVLIVPLWN